MKPAEIQVIYGDDPRKMTEMLAEQIGLAELIPPGASIALKPNLVVAKAASSGATTHPEIVAELIVYLQRQGFHEISIIEGSWVGADTEMAFQAAGYTTLAKEFNVPLIDLKHDATATVQSGGLKLQISRRALDAKFLINLPVLKAHCQTKLTCALKNLKGCIPDAEKQRYHSMGLHKPIAHLAAVLRSHLTIIDGICGDLSFEEGGTPVPMGRLIAGRDPVLLDAYAAHLIGLDPRDVPYIPLAASLGAGSDDLSQAQIREINPDSKKASTFQLSRVGESLARNIREKDACSACYGSLIHALYHNRGKSPTACIKIGQGYRSETGPGPGIGNCTRGLTPYLPGCPPTAKEIRDFLKGL